MADEKVGIKIVVDTKEGQQQTEKLGDKVQNAGKNAKKSEGAFASLGKTLKTLGVVTLIVEGFNFLKDAFMKNQKVADAITAVFDTLATIVNTLVTIFIDVTSEVSKSSGGFSALGKVMGGLITLVITPFKEVFYGIKLAIQEARLAWEKSPFGSGDATTIKELTKSIDETKEAFKDTIKNAVDAGKDIYNNFGEAAKSVGDVISGVVDRASKINVKAIYEQSQATLALKNNAKLAAADLAILVEKYDRQAESLRQIRDDESKSIEDRIKANDELGKVLTKQESAMIALAQKKVDAAAAELAQNKENIDLQVALKEAQAEVEAVKAKVAGLRSEQLVNQNNLLKEQIAINKAVSENDAKLVIDKKKANADLIKDELDRLEAKKQILAEESSLELARLQENINNTNLGTAARAEAEIAYNTKKQELDLQLQQFEDQIAITKFNRSQTELEKNIANTNLDFEFRKQAIDQELILLQQSFDNKTISEMDFNNKKKELSDRRLQISMEEVAAEEQLQEKKNALVLAGLNIIQAAAGENEKLANVIFAVQKALEIGKIISSTASAIAGVNAGVAAVPAILPPSIPNPAFPAAVALGVKKVIGLKLGAAAQIAEIAAASISKFKGKGSSSVGGAAAGGIATATPITPQPPQATTTKLDQQSINQLGSATTRAYVVESDVTNSQERITRISRAARLA